MQDVQGLKDEHLRELFYEVHIQVARHFKPHQHRHESYKQLLETVEQLVEKAYYTGDIARDNVSTV